MKTMKRHTRNYGEKLMRYEEAHKAKAKEKLTNDDYFGFAYEVQQARICNKKVEQLMHITFCTKNLELDDIIAEINQITVQKLPKEVEHKLLIENLIVY